MVEFTPEICSRTHYDFCCLKEHLDGLLSGIQARDQVMQRAYSLF